MHMESKTQIFRDVATGCWIREYNIFIGDTLTSCAMILVDGILRRWKFNCYAEGRGMSILNYPPNHTHYSRSYFVTNNIS